MNFFKWVLVPMLALLFMSRAQAVNFTLFVSCIDENGIYFGYESDTDFKAISSTDGGEVLGRAPSHFTVGRHEQVFGIKLKLNANGYSPGYWSVDGHNWGQTIFIDATTTAPSCPKDTGTGQPDGGIFEITAYVAGVPGVDRCTWEIRNHGDSEVWDDIDGSTGVEIDPETGIIFCRLPLGADNSDHDPINYRATVS